MNKVYIIQQQLNNFDYTDVYECCSLGLCKKAYNILKTKYPHNKYRIVFWRSYNV